MVRLGDLRRLGSRQHLMLMKKIPAEEGPSEPIQLADKLVISHRMLEVAALSQHPEDRFDKMLHIIRAELKPDQVFGERALERWAEEVGLDEHDSLMIRDLKEALETIEQTTKNALYEA